MPPHRSPPARALSPSRALRMWRDESAARRKAIEGGTSAPIKKHRTRMHRMYPGCPLSHAFGKNDPTAVAGVVGVVGVAAMAKDRREGRRYLSCKPLHL